MSDWLARSRQLLTRLPIKHIATHRMSPFHFNPNQEFRWRMICEQWKREKKIRIIDLKSRRVGVASYQVPTEVRGDRRMALSMRWIVQFANKRSSREYKGFAAKLAAELMDAAKNQGEAIKKRDSVQRMADANRAFAHFKW